MAEGINLAGAIGMTGKRESVISDLPAYIKDTGDYLAARNEQRRKEEAQKKAQEQEWENNQQENFSKNVSANLGSRVQYWNNEFEKYAQAETAKAYTAHLNPKLTLAQKQKAREEAHYNIAKAKSIYLNAEEDVDKKINPVANDDKYASQEAVDYLQGKRPIVSSELTNTQPVEFMGEKPATAPMEGATGEESRKVTTTHNKPLYEMNHEEIAKDYENGVAAKVLPMVKLHETSLDKIASEAIPTHTKSDFIKIVKKNINGVDEVTKTINHEGMVNAVESIYTNIITRSGKEATRMYNKLHQDAYIASKDNNNITNEQEREAFMDDYIKEHALGAAKTWVDTEYKNQEMANENIDQTANKGGDTSNSPSNSPVYTSASGQTQVYNNKKDLVEANLTKFEVNRTPMPKKIIKDGKEIDNPDYVPNVNYQNSLNQLNQKLINARQLHEDEKANEIETTIRHINDINKMRDLGLTHFIGGKPINIAGEQTYTDIHGNKIRGSIDNISMFQDDKGNYIKALTVSDKGKNGTLIDYIVPLNEGNLSSFRADVNKKGDVATKYIGELDALKPKQATPTKKEAPKKEESNKIIPKGKVR